MNKIAILFFAVLPFFAMADHPVTVESCGRAVTFEDPPLAAVSHDINLTEIMLELGLAESMVGYTGISGWHKSDGDLKLDGMGLHELAPKEPTREVLLAAGADFLFAGWNYGMRIGGEVTPDTLKHYGVEVYELTESCIHVVSKDRNSMEDLYRDILNLGRIFDVSDRAQELVDGYRETLARIPRRPENMRPRVFVYDSGEDTPFTAGEYAMPTAIIEAAGGRNITDDIGKSWATVSWEAVVARDPQFIVIIDYGEVSADEKRAFMTDNPAFANIDAVRSNRFLVLDYVEATPGPRNISAVEKLAKALNGI